MKYLRQLAILLACCVAGDGLSIVLRHKLPGNVLGLALLLALLACGAVKERQIADSADFLLHNMAFLFLPACLGIITIFPMIQREIWGIAAVCVLTMLCTAAATALTVHLVRRLQRGHRKKDVRT